MSESARKAESAGPSGSATLSVLAAQAEAVLFLAATPVPEEELKNVFGLSGREVTAVLEELGKHLAEGHGLVLKNTAGGWVLETNPHFAEVLSLFRDVTQKRHIRLSKAAVETLAVVSYNQPVTRGEIEDLRGVRCERVIERLLSHGLVRISGRKKTSGSPLLYRTTDRFLDLFGLEAVADLPTMEELKELCAAPVESADAEGEEDDKEQAFETKSEESPGDAP